MTTTSEHYRAPFALRSGADGTLSGICVPYGVTSMYAAEHPHGERFTPGSFARSIEARAGKIRLKSLHSGPDPMPVGVAADLREDTDGLHAVFRLYDTPEGRGARERAAQGVYGGLSVEFRPLRERVADDGVTEVTEAALHAVALVLEPAYEDARILAVRESAVRERDAHAWMWERVPAPPALVVPDLTRYLT